MFNCLINSLSLSLSLSLFYTNQTNAQPQMDFAIIIITLIIMIKQWHRQMLKKICASLALETKYSKFNCASFHYLLLFITQFSINKHLHHSSLSLSLSLSHHLIPLPLYIYTFNYEPFKLSQGIIILIHLIILFYD